MENNKKFVITISREFGSGGGEVAHKLAEKLGVPCYDKTVNQLTSVISGFSENAVKISEDKVSTPFDYTAFTHSNTLPVRDRIYIAQQKVIKQLADESSCIIVGRCAASILKNHENCVNVFICAPIEQRVKRISAQHNVSAEEAEKIIKQKDKERKNYYKKYGEMEWGKAQNYVITLNTVIGIDHSVSIIETVLKEFLNK